MDERAISGYIKSVSHDDGSQVSSHGCEGCSSERDRFFIFPSITSRFRRIRAMKRRHYDWMMMANFPERRSALERL